MAEPIENRPDTCCCIEITCSRCKASRVSYAGDTINDVLRDVTIRHGDVLRNDTDPEPVRGPVTDRDVQGDTPNEQLSESLAERVRPVPTDLQLLCRSREISSSSEGPTSGDRIGILQSWGGTGGVLIPTQTGLPKAALRSHDVETPSTGEDYISPSYSTGEPQFSRSDALTRSTSKGGFLGSVIRPLEQQGLEEISASREDELRIGRRERRRSWSGAEDASPIRSEYEGLVPQHSRLSSHSLLASDARLRSSSLGSGHGDMTPSRGTGLGLEFRESSLPVQSPITTEADCRLHWSTLGRSSRNWGDSRSSPQASPLRSPSESRREQDRAEIDRLLAKYLPGRRHSLDSNQLNRSALSSTTSLTSSAARSSGYMTLSRSSLGSSMSSSIRGPMRTYPNFSRSSSPQLGHVTGASDSFERSYRRSLNNPSSHSHTAPRELLRSFPYIGSESRPSRSTTWNTLPAPLTPWSGQLSRWRLSRQACKRQSTIAYTTTLEALGNSRDWLRIRGLRSSSEYREQTTLPWVPPRTSDIYTNYTAPTADDSSNRTSILNPTGRAQETYHEVQKSLQREPASLSRRSMRRRSRSAGSSAYHEQSDYSYGAAVGRLRDMLGRHDTSPHRKTVQFSPRSSGHYQSDHDGGGFSPSRSLPLPPRGELPTAEETVRLLQNQSIVVQQMEAENRYCKSELQELKTKVKTVVEENRMLHEELKRSVVAEILQGDVEVPGVPTRVADPNPAMLAFNRSAPSAGSASTNRPMTVQDYGKWQRELERLTTLHTAKTARLEAQLAHARDEATKYETEAETLRAKVRVQESLGTVGAGSSGALGLAYGLCIRCSENEAVTPATLVNQQSTVDRITKERDELMDQLTALKTTLQEMRHREEDSYAQVKKSVEMVEQAQLEQTQALVQREQLKEELLNMRQRMEEHVEEMQQKMVTERDIVRQETKAEHQELNMKLKELTEKLVAAEMQLDKTVRDKVSLQAELEAARGELNSFDIDYNKATDSMKMSMTHASLERNAAISELKRSKAELEQVQKEKHHEDRRSRSELSDLRRRLSTAEKELLNSKEQCIHLTTEIQSLSRETHLTKLAKESIEKSRSEDLRTVTRRAEQREEELNMLVETLENKHGQTTTELDEIIRTQNGLVQKLREECRHLTRQLEKLTTKYKGDNKHLASTNAALKVSLEKSRKRVLELERQNQQHAGQADKMRQRLRQLDEHCKRGSGQILELLAKESSLMRDRQLLAREIEFLRREATSMNDSDVDKIFAARGDMVDDVLVKVKEDETGRRDVKAKTLSSAVLIETDRGIQTDDLCM